MRPRATTSRDRAHAVVRHCFAALVIGIDALAISGVVLSTLIAFTGTSLHGTTGENLVLGGVFGGGAALLHVNGFVRSLGDRAGGGQPASFLCALEYLTGQLIVVVSLLLPGQARWRYVEEWQDALRDVADESGTSRWWRTSAEVLQCVRAAVLLAVILRCGRRRVSR